jgi:DNA topoisomerase-1
MSPAVFRTLSVDVEGEAKQVYLLRASGSVLTFPGFLKVYEEGIDEDSTNGEDNIPIPADIKEGDVLSLEKLLPEQHFTQPPPRFTEATLVRTMEENGIGRPSTYAPTISTIQARGYVFREEKRLFPTETGVLVNDLLVQYFNDLINTQFTAGMEADLDEISLGNRQWQEVVDDFYKRFKPDLDHAQEDMPEEKLEPDKVGRPCPECGHDLVIRWGRYGKFVSCSDFPTCRYTEPWLEKIGVHCPDCEDGEVVKRKTKKGRTFYGCSNYPECQFTSWKQPLPTPCPHCGGVLVYNNKREASCLKCEELTLLESIPEIQIES